MVTECIHYIIMNCIVLKIYIMLQEIVHKAIHTNHKVVMINLSIKLHFGHINFQTPIPDVLKIGKQTVAREQHRQEHKVIISKTI